jgi:hypothetical protein
MEWEWENEKVTLTVPIYQEDGEENRELSGEILPTYPS